MALEDKEHIASYFRAGDGNALIARKLSEIYAGVSDTSDFISGEAADYFASANGLMVEIQDKFHTRLSYTWDEIAPILRAMYQQERDGFFHDPASYAQESPTEPEVTAAPSEEAASPAMDRAEEAEAQQPEEAGPLTAPAAESETEPAIEAEAPPVQPEKKKTGRTRPELNYRRFEKLFPEIVSGEYRSLEMQAGESMMPLHVQWIAEDAVAVSHTYEQMGDLMYDPEMTFRIDREAGTLEPLTFQQDNLGIFQNVYPEPGKYSPKLRSELSEFTQDWFNNISQQGYVKTRAVAEIDGQDVEITFDNDGNRLEEQAEAVTEPASVPVEPDAETGKTPEQEASEPAPPEKALPYNYHLSGREKWTAVRYCNRTAAH